jgi:hypothetical protein
MGRITTLIALLIAFASSAHATGTGIPAGFGDGLADLIFYGLVYGGFMLSAPFLIFGFVLKGGYRLTALLVPVTYTLFLLNIFIKDISHGYLGAPDVLVVPSILALYLIGFAFYTFTHRTERVFAIVAALIFVTALVISNPTVINHDDYRFVDNNPLVNANEMIKLLGTAYGKEYVELSDGRVLKHEEITGIDHHSLDPAELAATDPGEFIIGFSAKREMTRQESTGYARHNKAIFKLKKNEIVINNYRKEEIAGWSPVNKPEAEEYRLMLAFAGLRKDCKDDEIRGILDSGVDVTIPMISMQHPVTKPIWTAVDRGCAQLVKILIEKGANARSKDIMRNSQTLLHTAVLNGSYEVVKQLLEHGANVSAIDADTRQPLHMAFVPENKLELDKKLEMADLLVKNGAKSEIKDFSKRPLDWLDLKQKDEVCKIVQEKKFSKILEDTVSKMCTAHQHAH